MQNGTELYGFLPDNPEFPERAIYEMRTVF